MPGAFACGHRLPAQLRPVGRSRLVTPIARTVPLPDLVCPSLPENLLRYFDETYLQQRQGDSAHPTIMDYRRVLVNFS